MSSSLAPNLESAIAGNYSISIVAIFSEAWRQIKGIKKAFWGGFALLFLTLLGVYVSVQFLLAVLHVFEFYGLETLFRFIAGGFFEVLRLLLSVSLVFLALQRIRQQTLNSTLVFEFRKKWRALAFIGVVFYLLNFSFVSGSRLIFNKFYAAGLHTVFAIGTGIQLIVFVFLFTYLALLVTMTMVLILDKDSDLKDSFIIVFKSVNQHWFKNIALLLLASLLFLVVGILTLGVGLIWLLPFLSLISAIQYQHIFCKGQ
jgi:hypothetical protein